MSIQATATGKLLSAKTATFKDKEGTDVTFGRVQLLQCDDLGFFSVLNLKVQSDHFGILAEAQSLIGKMVTVSVVQKTYRDKTTNFVEKLPKAA